MIKKRMNKRATRVSSSRFGTSNLLNSKRSMELEEIGKILFAVFIMVILIVAIWLLVSGKGGDALNAIRNLLRFGR